MTYENAITVYLAKIDDTEFCNAVGVHQELLLRTTHKGDLDGAFAAAVFEVAA